MSATTTPSKGAIALGSVFSIGPATAAISGTPTFVAVGEVQDINTGSAKASVSKWNTLDKQYTQKRAAVRDAGTSTVKYVRVPDDAGQTAVKAAWADLSGQTYRFQLTIPKDVEDTESADENWQCDAIISEYSALSDLTPEGVVVSSISLDLVNEWTIVTG